MAFVVTVDKAPGADRRHDSFSAAAKEARQLAEWGFGKAIVKDRCGKVCFQTTWSSGRPGKQPGMGTVAVAQKLGIKKAGVRDLADRLGLEPAAVTQQGKRSYVYWTPEAVSVMEGAVDGFRAEARRRLRERRAQIERDRRVREMSTIDAARRGALTTESRRAIGRAKHPHLIELFEWIDRNGGSNARDNTPAELFRGHARLAMKLAGVAARRLPIELDDAISAAFLGLAKAIRTYTPGRAKFSTFAHKLIFQQIARFAVRHPRGCPVVLPAGWIRKAKGEDPPNCCRAAMRAAKAKSLRIGHHDEETPPFELADPGAVDQGEDEGRALELARLEGAMRSLDRRDREVLAARFGLGGRARETQPQIGDRLGITKERVRQIENRAIARLRKLMGTTS